MRLLPLIGLLFILLLVVSLVQAEPSPELISRLKEVVIFEIKSMEQCEEHSEKFGLAMPYHRIILEKQQTIKSIADLIDNLGGTLDNNRLPLVKQAFLIQALNSDAQDQITVVSMYDGILNQFGHPDVRRIIDRARAQAMVHFMLLTNMGQKVIAETKLSNELKIQK